jgi:hypothetical protein
MNAVSVPHRLRPWLRGVLAGPLALVVAFLVMAGGALWLPEGQAKVNNLVLPVVLFPLLWTAFFLYACLDKKLTRAYVAMGALSAVNAALIAWHLMT